MSRSRRGTLSAAPDLVMTREQPGPAWRTTCAISAASSCWPRCSARLPARRQRSLLSMFQCRRNATLSRPAASPKATVTTPPLRPHVVVSRFRAADSTVITLATFTGAVRYRLHSGSEDPGPAALGTVTAGPSIAASERSQLLAVFNGGFKLSAGTGGYEQEGHVISPLRPGLASLVIDRSGAAQVGVWGSGLPLPGESVFSVRQNLVLLVRHGRVTAAAADWTTWGATLGGGEFVARSALGENARGELIYAASMSTAPADLGRCARARWRTHGDGTRHQSRMGSAGHRPGAGALHACRYSRPGPPGRPVPDRVDTRFHHCPRLTMSATPLFTLSMPRERQ